MHFDDLPEELQRSLRHWAVLLEGFPPEIDENDLTRRPADSVFVGNVEPLTVPIWVHEPFAKLVRQSSRCEFEKDPTEDELSNEYLRRLIREMKGGEPVKQIDFALQVHFTLDTKDRIFEILAVMMDSTLDKIYDLERDSELDDFDEVMMFTLSRTGANKDPIHPEAWAAPRFLSNANQKPSDLLVHLSSLSNSHFRVITLATPLQ